MAKFFEVTNVDSANSHLPNPLLVGEITMEIQDEEFDNSKFVKVYHNNGNNISVFSRSKFKKYLPKDKSELMSLIKNKGRA